MVQIDKINKTLSYHNLPTIKNILYVFPVEPQSAPRMTRSDRWKKRPVVTNYFNFKDNLRKYALINNFEISPILNLLFLMPIPESYSNKKKDKLEYTPHDKKPDGDNLRKAFQDAFNSKLFDDGAIWYGNTIKLYSKFPAIIVFN